jgi:transcription-repair coupling factor (superfamily II helicase)
MAAPLAPLLDRWRPEHLPLTPGRLVVPAPLRAFFTAGWAASAPGPVLAILPGERDAEDLAEDMALFSERVTLLPAWETLPFEHVSPNIATMAHRAEARHGLASGRAADVIVASVRAVLQRVSPSSPLPLSVEPGDESDRDDLIHHLAGFGYQRTDRVEARGEFAVRGGIVDVYPAQSDEPVRIDYWGDSIEALRSFSVATQRSISPVDALVAYPARELRPGPEVRERARRLLSDEPWAASAWDRLAEGIVFGGMESWLPWLAPERTVLAEAAPGTRVVLFDPVRSQDRAQELVKEETELAATLAPTWGKGAPEAGDHPVLYLSLDPALDGIDVLESPSLAGGPGDDGLVIRGLDATPGDADSVAAAVRGWIDKGSDVVVAMDGPAAADRVATLFGESGLDLPRLGSLESPGSAVTDQGIHLGFVAPDVGVAVLGEQEIAGRRRSHRRVRSRPPVTTPGYDDLSAGDYVVHAHHGIGRFEGLETHTVAGIERDYLVVAYAGSDRLFVPTDQLAIVQRYTGGEAPRLSRMGGSDWDSTRGRVREAVQVVAEEVVRLHRQRAVAPGHGFDGDTPWQSQFEAAFPFEETPDQLTAVTDVKADMEAARPMDRLIFGDVGFGKTEVALRAAFKAIQDQKQVAVLVPTTLLAQQHSQTFGDRFGEFPIRTEVLSRFLTPREQRLVVAGLASGEVDLVIGTHRLLSDDVMFRDLGLLVIDEEQRFGVAAKDKIKSLRTSVDVLTLTATPIPRTLEMALTGVREVSHIRTPPEDRHPILTYVGPYDAQAVSAAIRRELLREGQVFYVHNRVQSIDHAVAQLRELVPGARIAVAHGQMAEGRLEQVMLDFWNRDYDVLVATTIIESGLDLPQVNTLIVERADLLGLGQLYQLRGRVGRSSQRAYAYLFHPPEHHLSDDAYRRLEAVGEFSDLGSGFELARRDLQIRGAGSILGEVQSGHIAAVGFDLYTELVAEAVRDIEGHPEPVAEPQQVRIDLPVDAHLPESYVTEQQARLEAYRRLAAADTHDAVDDVAVEWADRYGPLPVEAELLTAVAHLRVEALRVGLEEVVVLRREVKLAPVALVDSDEVRLERVAPAALIRDRALFLPVPGDGVVEELLTFIRTMWPPPEE